jgi:hypothetical protein
MKPITPSQYAAKRCITLRAVTKMIREKNNLPGVSKIEKFGRFYLLSESKNKLPPVAEN